MVIKMHQAVLYMIILSITLGFLLSQLGMQAGLVYAQEFSSTANVEIVKGASDQNNGQFYVPAETQISAGQIMIIRFTL
jgi:hypothetical protein